MLVVGESEREEEDEDLSTITFGVLFNACCAAGFGGGVVNRCCDSVNLQKHTHKHMIMCYL